VDDLSFGSIDEVAASLLERDFEEKVWEVVKAMNGDKAPGPDGYSMRFTHALLGKWLWWYGLGREWWWTLNMDVHGEGGVLGSLSGCMWWVYGGILGGVGRSSTVTPDEWWLQG
jgi:hypothetical protein